ncbi:MAG: small subunit ribosomal protein, partial [Frankiaceae bacterium]|nr:small subunit ribosomal protein [Frankiaceae bacterium]
PEQVVQVGDEIMVKVIDIDLERRRISLSLKQANEGTIGEAVADHFDPALYGMNATYDDKGEYVYPEGFDVSTGEWLPGYETQQGEWERQYAEAQKRYEAHMKQIAEAKVAEAEATAETPSTYTSDAEAGSGTLASDEQLEALRAKLTGGDEAEGDAEPAAPSEPAAVEATEPAAGGSEPETPQADESAEPATEE